MYGEESGYVCYGTALQNAADIGASWKAAIKDPSLLRSLPVYKQKAVDDQGRTRFHGAFTGGFSAGYHNTVGSAAGFTPAEFSSSRSNRASSQQQTVLNFLDEDELAEHQKAAVQTKDLYDTYGARPRDAAVSKAEAELANRPGLVSGLLDELLPAADSAGVRLLQKMGWRPGRGVGIQASSQVAGAKWGSVSGVSVENTPLYVLEPKSGVHGLGYDPFAGAEEFREARARKRQRQDGAGSGFGAKSLQTVPVSGKRSRGVAFGSGLQHDDDAGVMEDYVEEGGPARLGYSFELISESDDEDRFDPKRSAYPMLQQHSAPQKMLQHRNMAAGVSFVAGFVMEKGLLETQLPEPPPAPPDFDPHHKFPPKPTSAAGVTAGLPPPPEVPAPSDPGLKREIESLAAQVARSGSTIEKMAHSMAAKGTGFLFLQGGEGLNYYKWRLYKIKTALDSVKGLSESNPEQVQAAAGKPQLTVQQRMELLGEEPLPSAVKPGVQSDTSAPLQRKPLIAESDRQRLQAALTSNFVRGETEEGTKIQPGLRTDPLPNTAAALAASFASRFTSGSSAPSVIEANATSFVQHTSQQPAPEPSAPEASKRSIFDWRPEPLLCKRFNVPDPYKGKPPPPPIIQQLSHLSRTDMLALPDTAAQLAAEQAEVMAAVTAVGVAGGQGAEQGGSASQSAANEDVVGRGSGAAAASQGLDAKSLASQFLSSLEHMLLAPDDDENLPLPPPNPPEPAAPTPPPHTSPAVATHLIPPDKQPGSQIPTEDAVSFELNKPLDLFKAIFEADDDEDGNEEEELLPDVLTPAGGNDTDAAAGKADPAARDTDAPTTGAAAGPTAPTPASEAVAPAGPAKVLSTPSELGAALLKAQQVAAQQLRDRSQATPAMVAPGPSRPPPAPDGSPPARRQEDIIREALKELKRSKHKSKKKHKKDSSKKGSQKKKKGGKDKDKKIRKHKAVKSKSSRRESRQSSDESSTDNSESMNTD